MRQVAILYLAVGRTGSGQWVGSKISDPRSTVYTVDLRAVLEADMHERLYEGTMTVSVALIRNETDLNGHWGMCSVY